MFCVSGMEGARLSGRVFQLGNNVWVISANRLVQEAKFNKNGKKTADAEWAQVAFREPTAADRERAAGKTDPEKYLGVLQYTVPVMKIYGEDGKQMDIEPFLSGLCIRERTAKGEPAKSFTIRMDGRDVTLDPSTGVVTVTPSAGFGIRTGRDVFDRAREKAIKNQKVFEERVARWRAAGGHVQRFA